MLNTLIKIILILFYRAFVNFKSLSQNINKNTYMTLYKTYTHTWTKSNCLSKILSHGKLGTFTPSFSLLICNKIGNFFIIISCNGIIASTHTFP